MGAASQRRPLRVLISLPVTAALSLLSLLHARVKSKNPLSFPPNFIYSFNFVIIHFPSHCIRCATSSSLVSRREWQRVTWNEGKQQERRVFRASGEERGEKERRSDRHAVTKGAGRRADSETRKQGAHFLPRLRSQGGSRKQRLLSCQSMSPPLAWPCLSAQRSCSSPVLLVSTETVKQAVLLTGSN